MYRFIRNIMRFARNETGQAMTEYELVMLLVSIVAIASLVAIGDYLSVTYTTIGTSVP